MDAGKLAAMVRNDDPFSIYFLQDKSIVSTHIPNATLEEPFTSYKVIRF